MRAGETWTGVRWRLDVGWEMRCSACRLAKKAAWWPLTHEFWNPRKGMSRCRACWNAYEGTLRLRRRGVGGLQRAVEARRAYNREWAAAKRIRQREAEGRRRYERRTPPQYVDDGVDERQRASDNRDVTQPNTGGAPVILHVAATP